MNMKKICRFCGQEKDITSFYKHKQQTDGYLNKCKICYRRDIRKWKIETERIANPSTQHLKLSGANHKDYCEMYSFLSKMGYNVEGDIHAQFLERHGLKVYKQRSTKNKNTYTYQDCKKNPYNQS